MADLHEFVEFTTNCLPFGKVIGSGSFGGVRLVHDKRTDLTYAAKICAREEERAAAFKAEWAVLSSLHHPHIVGTRSLLIGVPYSDPLCLSCGCCCFSPLSASSHCICEHEHSTHDIPTIGACVMVLQYLPYNLLHVIDTVEPTIGRSRELLVGQFFFQVLEAVHYCHSKRIAIRDLKLDNILLDENFQVKLIDFGLAAKVEGDGAIVNHQQGSMIYHDPLMMRQDVPYNLYDADFFSLGVCLFVMLTGNVPWVQYDPESYSPEFTQLCVTGDFSAFSSSLSANCIDLLRGLLRYDPSLRFKRDQIYTTSPENPSILVATHPWLTDQRRLWPSSRVAASSPSASFYTSFGSASASSSSSSSSDSDASSPSSSSSRHEDTFDSFLHYIRRRVERRCTVLKSTSEAQERFICEGTSHAMDLSSSFDVPPTSPTVLVRSIVSVEDGMRSASKRQKREISTVIDTLLVGDASLVLHNCHSEEDAVQAVQSALTQLGHTHFQSQSKSKFSIVVSPQSKPVVQAEGSAASSSSVPQLKTPRPCIISFTISTSYSDFFIATLETSSGSRMAATLLGNSLRHILSAHPNSCCAVCRKQIHGIMFTCCHCEHYQLCSECEASSPSLKEQSSHDPSKHVLLRIDVPIVDQTIWKNLPRLPLDCGRLYADLAQEQDTVVACDICGASPLVEPRHKILSVDDFDACHACMSSLPSSQKFGALLKIPCTLRMTALRPAAEVERLQDYLTNRLRILSQQFVPL